MLLQAWHALTALMLLIGVVTAMCCASDELAARQIFFTGSDLV